MCLYAVSVTDHLSQAAWPFTRHVQTLEPLTAGTCLSEKRISMKHEETVSDRMWLRVTQLEFHNA